MKLFITGMDPVRTAALRERGYTVVSCAALPEPEAVKGSVLIVTTAEVTPGGLAAHRARYPEAELIYWHTERGIAGSRTAAALCAQHGIRFLRPGIAAELLADQLDAWLREPEEAEGSLIGVFGSLPGIGVTRIAATLAQLLAQQGKTVALLSLNLYNPGWGAGMPITLDRWRQRLTARLLQPEDIRGLERTHGFLYLPGNADPLATLDYTEDDLAYLLSAARREADVVIGDFGAIPESAAWFAGMQQASVRLMVTHPSHTARLGVLLRLAQDTGIAPEHLWLIANRMTAEDVPLRAMAASTGTQPLFSLPYKGWHTEFTLPLSKKEQETIEGAMQPLLMAMGLLPAPAKKKGWF